MIHDVFNEDLLTRYRKLYFLEQHMKLALLPDIINKEEEYEVEEIRRHRK